MLVNSMLVNSTQLQPTANGNKTEAEATYYTVLKLDICLDEDLTCGIRHYRDRTGRLLTTLDEVVRAILAGSLPEEV